MAISMEKWEGLTEEEQAEMLRDYPNTVPDAAKSEQKDKETEEANEGAGGVSEEGADEESEEVSDDENLVVYKGKEIPLQNLIGEHVRKATKDKDKDIDELKSIVNTLISQSPSQRNATDKSPDYWQEQAEKIAQGLIKIDDQTGDPVVDPSAVMELLRASASVYEEARGIEKSRQKEINSALRQLTAEEKDLIGDLVADELEAFPLGKPISKKDIDRTIAYARGFKQDKILEQIKKDLTASLSKGKKKIAGEITEDSGANVPRGGSRTATKGKRPTPRQIALAHERGISVEKQVEIDEKLKKIRENRK